MKVDKTKLVHWVYLALFGLWVSLGLVARVIWPTAERKVVVLYGHKLQGNLLAIKREIDSQDSSIECLFLTLDPDYYSQGRGSGWLLALNPLHMFRVATADCIVTDHGLHALNLFLKFTTIKFVDVWHGVPFKGFIPDDFRVQHQYDEIWVSSPAMKRIYLEKFGFAEEQVWVTGYGRLDTLLEYASKPTECIELLGLDPSKSKRALFAPTWRQELPLDVEGRRVASLQEMLTALDLLAEGEGIEVIFRPHLNFSWTDIETGPNVEVLDSARYTDTEAILAVADCLITDWSSIAFDLMALNRPMVFIGCEPPFKHSLTLPGRFRAGRTVENIEALKEAILDALEDPAKYNAPYADVYREATEVAWGATLDGLSTSRYVTRLAGLLEAN